MTNQYPWSSNTTPPIASQDDPRYETPGGAQHKIDTHVSVTGNIADRAVTQPKIADWAVGARQIDPALLEHYGDIATNAKFEVIDEQLADIVINARSLGLLGNGTDESALLTDAINYVADNHYTLLIPREMTISVNVMTISNKSSFGIRCEGTIKRLDSSPTVGALLRLENCSSVSIPLMNFDGNGLNNGCNELVAYTSTQEQKHSMVLYGCNRIRIGDMYSHNSCGDVLYITNGSYDITANSVNGTADAYIGRNVVSIISAQNVDITSVNGRHFGHYDMPGGLDIEPNANTEIVRNVHVGLVQVEGAEPYRVQSKILTVQQWIM